jgi:cytochrome c
VYVALVLLGAVADAACANERTTAGRAAFDTYCRACHGGTARADSPIGPSLVGIVGRKAGTGPSGVHSRAMMESGIVWDRERLRRFIAAPASEVPNTLMSGPPRAVDPSELDPLLDYLESLR